MGTVIDPTMTDELKVTVVATGLGAEITRAPLQVVASEHRQEVDSVPNYKDLDKPAIRRKRAATDTRAATVAPADSGEDYFDITAFLRRHAD